MLRRKPTALTITADDIALFEEQLAREHAESHYLKTGEDPQGLFTQPQRLPENDYEAHMQGYGQGQREMSVTVDPNDELKPLPGAKASIVRNKDERIIGAGNAFSRGAGAGAGR
jgi:hypothetical protein